MNRLTSYDLPMGSALAVAAACLIVGFIVGRLA
jgi:hypothetical protein